jgi:hypothetical protein
MVQRFSPAEKAFNRRVGRIAFRLYNPALVIWAMLTFYPLAFAQLVAA